MPTNPVDHVFPGCERGDHESCGIRAGHQLDAARQARCTCTCHKSLRSRLIEAGVRNGTTAQVDQVLGAKHAEPGTIEWLLGSALIAKRKLENYENQLRAEAWDAGVLAKSNSSSIFDADVLAQNPYRRLITGSEPTSARKARLVFDCDETGCTRTVDDGPLHRVNPRGEPGIFMCDEHARAVNQWDERS